MRAFIAAVLCGLYGLAAVGAPVPAKPGPAATDGDRLQGEWRCVKMAANGRIEPPTPPGPGDRSLVVTFTPGKVSFGQLDGKGGAAMGRPEPFSLDPSADPRRIDIGDKKRMKGIYELDGDRLRIQHPLVLRGKEDPSVPDRPGKFEIKGGDRTVYMELERVRP